MKRESPPPRKGPATSRKSAGTRNEHTALDILERRADFVAATDLTGEAYRLAVEYGADVALAADAAAVVVGAIGSDGDRRVLACTQRRCCPIRDRRVLVVVPDVVALEGLANGLPPLADGVLVVRSDGRSVRVYLGRRR